MLSAQTTDVGVNKVTSVLFPKYQKPNEKYKNVYIKYNKNRAKKSDLTEIINFAFCDLSRLENDIQSIGLFKNKAKNIRTASRILLDRYGGKVPKTMDELITLPGVGRKTANVVLGNAYGIYEGIAVDTHVKKLSRKYGFTKEKIPEKIEKDLMTLFDKKHWFKITYLLIEHGRNIRKTKKDFLETYLQNRF